MREDGDTRLRFLLVAILLLIVVAGTIDLILDAPADWTSAHVVFELVMISGALVMATALWLGWWRAERSLREVRRSLEDRREERDAWRRSARRALEGLGQAIDERFRRWQLTPAEREVALHLLKGHSHKRIAQLTERSERTVRQHATVVYQKAGLGGRAELAAFFLEDLMLPEESRQAAEAESESAR